MEERDRAQLSKRSEGGYPWENPQSPPRQVPEAGGTIMDTCKRLEKEIAVVHTLIEQLGAKIAPIMNSQHLATEKDGPRGNIAYPTPMANLIAEMITEVAAANAKINQMIEAVDI